MSSYTTNLALYMMDDGTTGWGASNNINIGTLLEQAVSGYVTQAITDGADTVITIPNGATGVARNMYIECTGPLTGNRNLIVPSPNKKLYFIYNNTTGGFSVTVKVAAQTGVIVPFGKKMLLVSNGTDIFEAVTYFGTFTASSINNTPIGNTTPSTGAFTTLSSSGLASLTTLNVTGAVTLNNALPIAQGGTGATTAGAARTNLGVSGTGSDTTYCYRANNLSDVTAATARTNLGLTTMDQAATASTIAQRNGSGYLFAGYFNMSGAVDDSSAINNVMYNIGGADGYLRRCSLAHFAAAISPSITPADPGSSKAVNGYQEFASGIILQWGLKANVGGSGGVGTVALPITFPNAIWTAYAVQNNDHGGGSAQSADHVAATNTSTITITNNSNGTQSFYWLAIGN